MTVGILWKSGGKDFRVAGRVSNYGGGGGGGGEGVYSFERGVQS